MRKSGAILVFAALALFALSSWAVADGYQPSPWVTSIIASSGELSAVYTLDPLNLDSANGVYLERDGVRTWSLNEGVILQLKSEDGSVIAEVDKLNLKIDSDPSVDLDFNIRNTTASSITVGIQSEVVDFDAIANPEGYATAALTVTDRNRDTATATGLFSGTKSYQARYNNTTVWANLIDPITAPIASSNTGEERKPALPAIWAPINDTLTSIESEFKFTLTPKDSASGTSTFEVQPTPEPGTLLALSTGLLGLSAFAFKRRN